LRIWEESKIIMLTSAKAFSAAKTKFALKLTPIWPCAKTRLKAFAIAHYTANNSSNLSTNLSATKNNLQR
jgi:hypothetical protein